MTIFSALSCADNWQILVHSLTVIGKEEQHTCLPMRPSSATKVTPPPPTVLKYTNHYRTLVRSDLKNGKLNSKSSPIFSALRKYVRRTSSRIFAGRISSSILTFKTFLIKHCWLGAEWLANIHQSNRALNARVFIYKFYIYRVTHISKKNSIFTSDYRYWYSEVYS